MRWRGVEAAAVARALAASQAAAAAWVASEEAKRVVLSGQSGATGEIDRADELEVAR